MKMMMIQDGPMPTGADKPLRISGDPYKVQVRTRQVAQLGQSKSSLKKEHSVSDKMFLLSVEQIQCHICVFLELHVLLQFLFCFQSSSSLLEPVFTSVTDGYYLCFYL